MARGSNGTMRAMEFSGQRVLVTGASSGLGAEMARQLGRQGAHLVLAARRAERLEALADELRGGGSEVEIVAVDLTKDDDVATLISACTSKPLFGAILNAGVTHFGYWDELSWEGFERMLNLNVRSVVRLVTELVPHIEGTQGGILLVSSMAGLAPVPYQAAYSGTKAFLVHYGCGLYHELEGRDLSLTVFAPGGIQTEMTEGKSFDSLRGWLMPVDACAKSAISGFRKRKYVHVPGFLYRLMAWGNNLAPEPFTSSRVAAQYRTSLEANKE